MSCWEPFGSSKCLALNFFFFFKGLTLFFVVVVLFVYSLFLRQGGRESERAGTQVGKRQSERETESKADSRILSCQNRVHDGALTHEL